MATITYGETAVVDRAGRVEEAGVAYIPEAERDSRPANLATVFFGGNLAFSVIVFGWLPVTFGLGWWATVTSAALGLAIGTLITAPLALLGPRTGTNNTVSSGAHFGVTGRLVGSALTLAFALAYAAIAVWTSGDALVAGAHRLFGTPAGDGALAVGYALIAAEIALVALYGHATVVALQRIVVPVVGVLLLLGVFAFAGDFHASGSGEFLLGGFWPTWALAVTVAAAGPLSYAPSLGDYTRRISSAHGDRRVLAAAGLGVYGGLLATTLFGAFTALCLTHLGDSYVGDLVAAAPAWYVLPILVIGLAGGVGQGVLNMYASGLDLAAIVPNARRVHATLITSVLAIALVFLGTFALNAVDSITAMTLVLNGVAAPWVVVNLLGFLVARRRTYDPHDLQAFNEGRRGGRYWFTGGWNLRAIGAWGGRLRLRPAGRHHRPLHRPAGEPRRRRRPVPRRLGARRRGRLPHRAGRLAGRRFQVIDPLTRWAAYGEKPDYCGLMTYAGLPYTEDPAELEGVDVAIVGAPMDELTSDSPGTRFGPRAIRAASCAAGPHLEAGVDALRDVLRVVDFGDAPILPADPVRSHTAIQATVAQVLAAGAMPVILGGDHSIAEPDIRAVAEKHGPVGLIHFDTHTDTGREVFGATLSHGSCMYRLVESGHIDPERYVQIGLRGYWPGAEEFGWQAERGIVSHFMHDVRDRGIRAVVADTIEHVGAGPVFLSVDIDVLDPAFAPGTGTPEPGGMTSGELLWACRELATAVDLVGHEIVEVLPDRIGSRDITALVAERVVRETLTGVAARRLVRT